VSGTLEGGGHAAWDDGDGREGKYIPEMKYLIISLRHARVLLSKLRSR